MQQINLYTYLPHPVKSILDARALSVLFGVFCLMLMLTYCVGLMQKHQDKVKLAQANQGFQVAKDRLSALVLQFPSAVTTAPDVAKLAYCKFKFSTKLEALAAAIVPGVWLSDISIAAQGESLAIKGHALIEGQVQLYVEQLNNQKTFQQTPLVLQDMTRGDLSDKKADDNILNFQITTKAPQTNG
jgi:hypothetical protein